MYALVRSFSLATTRILFDVLFFGEVPKQFLFVRLCVHSNHSHW